MRPDSARYTSGMRLPRSTKMPVGRTASCHSRSASARKYSDGPWRGLRRSNGINSHDHCAAKAAVGRTCGTRIATKPRCRLDRTVAGAADSHSVARACTSSCDHATRRPFKVRQRPPAAGRGRAMASKGHATWGSTAGAGTRYVQKTTSPDACMRGPRRASPSLAGGGASGGAAGAEGSNAAQRPSEAVVPRARSQSLLCMPSRCLFSHTCPHLRLLLPPHYFSLWRRTI